MLHAFALGYWSYKLVQGLMSSVYHSALLLTYTISFHFAIFFLRQNLPNLPRLTINWCRHSELRRMHGPPVLAPQELEIICLSSPQIHHSLLLESQLLLNWFLCIRYKRSHSDWAGGDSDTMGFRLVVTKRHEKYLKVRVKRKNILPCFLRSS